MVCFKWGSEAEHFSGPIVETVGDFVEVFLRINIQVDALRQILPDEAVGVFVCGSLPRTVGVAEVDFDFQLVSKLGMPCHFLSLIVGHADTHGFGNLGQAS